MISSVYIKINAANPSLSLAPAVAFVDSPSSVRVIDVPKKIGNWKITNVYATFSYPDGSEATAECVLKGNCWTGTVDGSTKVGYVESGFQVTADGLDENGDEVVGYVLGQGDVEILGNSIYTEDGTKWNIKICEETPENPNIGDTIYEDGGYKIWDGTEWKALGGSSYTSGYGIKIEDGVISISATIPTKTSQLENDSNFLTSHQSLDGYATESWVEGKNYLTSHQSLDGYATESWVEGKNYLTSHQDISQLALSADVQNNFQQKGDYALSDDVKNNFQPKGNYLTSHQSLEGYATESWVEGKGYLTSHQDISQKLDRVEFSSVSATFLTSHQSLDNYYQKSETSSAVEINTAIEGAGKVKSVNGQTGDVSVYVPTKVSELTNDAGYLTSHQSLDGYATESWVEGKGYLTSHQSLSDYYKKSETSSATEINSKFAEYALSDDVENNFQKKGNYLTAIPDTYKTYDTTKTSLSTDGYATQKWVEDKNYLTSHQSLDGYATQSWVESKNYLTSHQDISKLALSTDVQNNFQQKGDYALSDDVKNNFQPKGNYLTSHQSLEGYATESWVEGKGYLTSHQSLSDYYKKTETSSASELSDIVDSLQTSIASEVAARKDSDSELSSAISSCYTKSETSSAIEISTAVANAGKVKTVNNIEPDENGNIDIAAGGSSYKLVTLTATTVDDGLSCQVDNYTVSRLTIDDYETPISIYLPKITEDDEVRDFILRLENTTLSTANVIFAPIDSEDLSYECDDDSWAEVESGVNIISFTETKRV